jgi:asparagine synthetase A
MATAQDNDDDMRAYLAFDEAIMDSIHDIYVNAYKDMQALEKVIRKHKRNTTYRKYIDNCITHLRRSVKKIEDTNLMLCAPVDLTVEECDILLHQTNPRHSVVQDEQNESDADPIFAGPQNIESATVSALM